MNLVELRNNKPMTTSLLIAETFNKEHKNVIVKIREKSHLFTQLNFQLSEYEDSTGRKLPMYLLDRDFTTFLIMGFTGSKADEWKLKYINAFNQMEQALTQQSVLSSDIIEVIEKMSKDNTKQLMDMFTAFTSSFNTSMSNLSKLLITQQSQPLPALPVSEHKPIARSSISPEAKAYKIRIYALCDKILASTSEYKNRNALLSETYKQINKQYGLCWDQLLKDYKYEHNLDTKPSLIDAIAESSDSSHYKSILESILEDKAATYGGGTIELSQDNTPILTTWASHNELIEQLASKNNDTSPYAIVTYRKIYHLMDEHNSINWSYHKSDYKKANNIRSRNAIINKKKLIGSSRKLQKLFLAELTALCNE